MTISFNRLLEELKEADNILILTHRKPDGDTLGSAAALTLCLRQLGKKAWMLKNPDLTPRFAPMTEGLWWDGGAEGKYILSVDIADRSLMCDNAPENIRLAIDHHSSHRDFADKIYCRPEAAACGEVIYDIICGLDCRFDSAMADAVYTAVATDTGCFRFNNTTSETHRVAAACLEAGADFKEINYRCFRLKTKARAGIEAHLYSNMLFCRGGKGAVGVITRETIKRLGASEDDLDNLSSLIVETEGVEVGVLLTERAERDGFKVSMRSGKYDVSKICALFGGGGHAGAAGCTLYETSVNKAVDMLVKALEDAIDA